jgi:hypothetical protein
MRRRTLATVVAVIAALATAFVATPANARVIRTAAAVSAGTVSYGNECPDEQFFDMGCLLTVIPGEWSAGEAEVTLSFQWMRNGKAIPGETGMYHTITAADRNKNITLKITGSAPGYTSTTASSTPVKSLSGKVCTIVGTTIDETLVGTKGADVICGVGGSDVITPLAGNDVVDGGGNDSTVVYSADKAATTVVLPASTTATTGSAKNSATGTDALMHIDNVFTGSGNDVVTGSSRDNIIRTGAGNDTIHAGDGADHVNGGAGNDAIYGDGGDDRLAGLTGEDKLYGGLGDDLCDASSTYSDALDSCDISTERPTLSWTAASMNGLGVQIDDELGLIRDISVFLTDNGKFEWGQLPLEADYTSDRAGLRTYQWFDFSSLQNNTWGRKFVVILVGTEDGRSELWRGQATDLFVPNSDPTTTVGSWDSGEGNHRSFIDFAWDIAAPVVESVTASVASVDTTSEDQTVSFTVGLAGGETASWLQCSVASLAGDSFEANFFASAYESNTCDVIIPANTPAGWYGLTVDVRDAAMNGAVIEPFSTVQFYDAHRNVQQLEGDFEGLKFQDTGYTTLYPVTIGPVTFSATTVSTRTAARTITATFDVADATTEDIIYAGCTLKNPLASGEYPSADAVALSSTTMRASFSLPKGAPKGTYVLDCYLKTSGEWVSHFIGHTNGEFTWTGPISSTVNSDSSKLSYITVN